MGKKNTGTQFFIFIIKKFFEYEYDPNRNMIHVGNNNNNFTFFISLIYLSSLSLKFSSYDRNDHSR